MRTRIKVCGITRWEDARLAADLGVDALGFILCASPRSVSPEVARDLCARLPPYLDRVGVFVDADRESLVEAVRGIGLTRIQLHGQEEPALVEGLLCPVTRTLPAEPAAARAEARRWRTARPETQFLLDLPKGGPRPAAEPAWRGWRELVAEFGATVAGDLDPTTVGLALTTLRPPAVDVARGVEARPGIKDPDLLARFVGAVRAHDHALECSP